MFYITIKNIFNYLKDIIYKFFPKKLYSREIAKTENKNEFV